jgi:hypothetical protein
MYIFWAIGQLVVDGRHSYTIILSLREPNYPGKISFFEPYRFPRRFFPAIVPFWFREKPHGEIR